MRSRRRIIPVRRSSVNIVTTEKQVTAIVVFILYYYCIMNRVIDAHTHTHTHAHTRIYYIYILYIYVGNCVISDDYPVLAETAAAAAEVLGGGRYSAYCIYFLINCARYKIAVQHTMYNDNNNMYHRR